MSLFDIFKKKTQKKETVEKESHFYIEKAPAKINLAIDIKGVREDGYHLLDMITLPLKLHDTLDIEKVQTTGLDKGVYLYCDDSNIICDESNIAYRALQLVKEKIEFKNVYTITIHKRIPISSGLGGGSADGAAVIRSLWKKLSEDDKKYIVDNLSEKIGCDVLYCIDNKPARVTGIGDNITPIKVKTNYFVLLVKPNKGLSTVDVYKKYNEFDDKSFPHPNIDNLIAGLENDDENLISENMENVLKNPAISMLPEIKTILDIFKENNIKLSSMTGTGSCCFALFKDEKHLKKVQSIFEKKGYETYLTQTDIKEAIQL